MVLPIPTINQSAYNASKDAITNLNLESFLSATMSQYTGVLSNYVYLFIWGIIFMMIWIRQRSITIPSTIGLILGGIVIAMLPEQYQFIAQFMIAMGGFALLYVMFGERR